MTPEREIEALVDRLESEKTFAMDTSSLICLEKAGALVRLGDATELITVGQVLAEGGWAELPVRCVESADTVADDAVLALARAHRVPLVSEDRKLLLRAERAGVDYYNALLMLVLLLLKGCIDFATHQEFYRRLVEVSRYSARVSGYAAEVLSFVRMNR